ncbi:MAG: hypothetical protein U5K00_17940 [Melioribacteraceae bacterium]|nr:hypothetical protein [Melioribacteraceae bacterium]
MNMNIQDHSSILEVCIPTKQFFSGGFFLSGYADNQLFANAQATASLIQDYLPGNVGSSPSDANNNVYGVRESDPPFGAAWQNWRNAVEQELIFTMEMVTGFMIRLTKIITKFGILTKINLIYFMTGHILQFLMIADPPNTEDSEMLIL